MNPRGSRRVEKLMDLIASNRGSDVEATSSHRRGRVLAIGIIHGRTNVDNEPGIDGLRETRTIVDIAFI